MLNNSIAAEWESFNASCCKDFTDQQRQNAQHIFYAAFHAALLMVRALPHIHDFGDEAITNNLIDLNEEANQYWADQKKSA